MMRSIRNRLVSAALAAAGFAVFSLAPLPAMAEGSLVIRDFVLSHGIDQREPVDATEFFRTGDDRAVAFARIHNTGAPTRVSFVWHYGETTHANVPVTVGTSPGWRTWSSVRLRPGTWRVELVDAQGAVLAEKTFGVGHDSTAPIAMDAERGDAIGEGVPASVVYPTR